nr:carboxypeptidase-like regulatory domain-containing protein [uncultured Allomuricauda sp.]
MLQKLVIVLFGVCCICNGYGQSDILLRKVTISFEDQSVREALSKLRKQERFFLVYADDEISDRVINEKFEDESLGTIVKKVWGKDNIKLKSAVSTVCIISLLKGYLKGQVQDDKGNTVPFALVAVKGSNLGAVTDESGYFEIAGILEGPQVLTISSIGYESKEQEIRIKPNTMNTVAVEMPTAVSALDEVVVEGLSVSKKIAQSPI